METNETPTREEQPSQKYPHVTVETDNEEEESENETLTNNQTEDVEEEEIISPHQEPEQESTQQQQQQNPEPPRTPPQTGWKTAGKVATGAGVGLAVTGSIAYYGYSVLWKQSLIYGMEKAGTAHAIKAGLTAAKLTKGYMAGKGFWASLSTGVASMPLWGWVGIAAVIGGGYLAYKNWDKIQSGISWAWSGVTSWFGFKNPVERVVERVISRPITENIVAPYIIRETEEERQTRNLSHEISGLRLDMDNFQTNMQELLERRSEIGTTVFEEQQQQLETQMAETQTRLNELQARYNAIPEEIRRSSAAKAEQIQNFQNYLTQGTSFLLLFLVNFFFVWLWKKVRKLLGWDKRKKKGEAVEKMQEQVKALNTELQVQKVEKVIEQIRQEKTAQKTKEIKNDQSQKTSPSLTTKEPETDCQRVN